MSAIPALRLPGAVRQVCEALRAAGGEVWLVGGGVRDHLRGQPIVDWDLEVYGLDEAVLQASLESVGHVHLVGRAFGVFKVRPFADTQRLLDVSLPRRDSKIGSGHRGILAEGDPQLSKEEATTRRDLTVNAMMLSLPDGALLDLHGGREDLEAGRLRAVNATTFLEDPLRALRAVQFAARLDFDADPSLVALCAQAALDELPAERVLGEWAKLMLRGVRPSRGLTLAREAGVLARVFPALQDDPALDALLDMLAGAPGLTGPAHGARHLCSPMGRALCLMLAAWLQRTPQPEGVLDALGLHRYEGFPARRVLSDALSVRDTPLATGPALRHLSRRAELAMVIPVRQAMGEAESAACAEQAEREQLWVSSPAPWVQGRDLIGAGVQPSPTMGDALEAAYVAQLDGLASTPEQALTVAVNASSPE